MKKIGKKENHIRNTVEKLYVKRYQGLNTDEKFEPLYPLVIQLEEDEERIFASNFRLAFSTKEEVYFNCELFLELEKLAKENNVEVSIYINYLLLKMLERNRETRSHTRGKKVYINTMLTILGDYLENKEAEITENLNSPDFIKFKGLTYNNVDYDEKIYIVNYLLNKGYCIEQIRESQEKEQSYLKLESETGCSVRLGLHYCLISSKKYKTYKEVEQFLNNKMEKGKIIWDLYTDYLNDELI